MLTVAVVAALVALPAQNTKTAGPSCAPRPGRGVPVTVDAHIPGFTAEQVVAAFTSEAMLNAVAPASGLKSRALVQDDVASDGRRFRRIRMRPAVEIPPALRAFGSEDQLVYDEVATWDADRRTMRFHMDNAVCDRVRYGGTLAFVDVADGVRVKLRARLEVDAFMVGGLVEGLVRGGVEDGWKKLASFTRTWLEKHPTPTAQVAAR